MSDLWNFIYLFFLKPIEGYDDEYAIRDGNRDYIDLKNLISLNFLGYRVDEISQNCDIYIKEMKHLFFNCKWYIIYDLIEFICKRNDIYDGTEISETVNTILKKYLSAYRLVNLEIIEITNEQEIGTIEKAIENNDKFIPVKTHLSRSLELLSDKKKSRLS